MRHQKNKITLDRKVGPRKALLSGLAASLVLYEKIVTTKAKAKATQSMVEKLITKAKKNTLAARRDIIADLSQEVAAKKLMEVLGPRFAQRPGGFTRLINLRRRKGDGAEEVLLEFV
jgi:large subunit ribosomal protein L17